MRESVLGWMSRKGKKRIGGKEGVWLERKKEGKKEETTSRVLIRIDPG